MRGSPARTYEAAVLVFRRPDTCRKAVCCVTGTMAGSVATTTLHTELFVQADV
jgi:hypothetical protein